MVKLLPMPDDDEKHEAICLRYVSALPDDALESQSGRYLNLLHGNFMGLPSRERDEFMRALASDAHEIDAEDLTYLLSHAGWREHLTAAWLIGVGRRTQFRDVLEELLRDGVPSYSGQGLCFAFTALGTHEDAEILVAYLNRCRYRINIFADNPPDKAVFMIDALSVLPPKSDPHGDHQEWALGALVYLDTQLRSNYAELFLGPQGSWRDWYIDHYGLNVAHFERLIAYACTF